MRYSSPTIVVLYGTLLCAAVGLMPSQASAVTAAEVRKLTPDQALNASVGFGKTVAISGDRAIISSVFGDTWLFDTTTGNQISLLNTGAIGQQLGASIAMAGNLAAVGNNRAGSAGEVFLFDTLTGGLVRTIPAPADGQIHEFGTSVAFHGNTVLIGDTGVNTSGGAVHVYDVTTGNLLSTLTPSNPASSSGIFGNSMAVSGDTAVIGARNEGFSTEGAAYLFDLTTGQQIDRLSAADAGITSTMFGQSVAISGGIAIVGTFADDNALVFDASTGAHIRTLTGNGTFGRSVAIRGDIAAVGSEQGPVSGIGLPGTVSLFDVTTGALLDTFTGSDATSNDRFGSSVAFDGDQLLAGAPALSNISSNNIGGATYLFTIPEPGTALVLGMLGCTAVMRRRAS